MGGAEMIIEGARHRGKSKDTGKGKQHRDTMLCSQLVKPRDKAKEFESDEKDNNKLELKHKPKPKHKYEAEPNPEVKSMWLSYLLLLCFCDISRNFSSLQ